MPKAAMSSAAPFTAIMVFQGIALEIQRIGAMAPVLTGSAVPPITVMGQARTVSAAARTTATARPPIRLEIRRTLTMDFRARGLARQSTAIEVTAVAKAVHVQPYRLRSGRG